MFPACRRSGSSSSMKKIVATFSDEVLCLDTEMNQSDQKGCSEQSFVQNDPKYLRQAKKCFTIDLTKQNVAIFVWLDLIGFVLKLKATMELLCIGWIQKFEILSKILHFELQTKETGFCNFALQGGTHCSEQNDRIGDRLRPGIILVSRKCPKTRTEAGY